MEAPKRPQADGSSDLAPPLKTTEVQITGADSEARWTRFEAIYSDHPALREDVIYALPHSLIDAICEEPGLEDFLSEEEAIFERDLADCEVGGFFLESPFSIPSQIELTFKRTMLPGLKADVKQKVKAANSTGDSSPQAKGRNDAQKKALEKMKQDAATDCWGYAGWLVTEQGFLKERDEFRSRWEPTVKELGYLPPRPPHVDLDASEVVAEYREFMAAYLEFLNRWGLQELVTWDLPVPLRPLHFGPGREFPSNIMSAGYMFWEPCYRLREDKKRLNLVAEVFLDQAVPEHLRGWLSDRPPKWGPERFARVWELFPFYELALKRRYEEKLQGNLDRLDRALTTYLYGTGKWDSGFQQAESVKDARQMITRRLREET